MLLKPSTVSFDEGPDFPCFLSPNTWNGWAMPYFTKEQADVVVASGVGPFAYDAEADTYSYTSDPNYPEDTETYEAVEHEGVKLYGLGTGSLCWNYPYEDEAGNNPDPWAGNIVAGAWKMLRAFISVLWREGNSSDNCPALKAVFQAEGQEEDEAELRKVLALALLAADALGLPVSDNLREHTLAIVKGENPFAD